MKVLLSAFACRPGGGSEPGVGWHWAEEIALLGHEVHVLTRSQNVPFCERAAAESGLSMVIHGYDLPRWARWWKSETTQRGMRPFYLLWQWRAFPFARALQTRERFDIVHHITFGAHRYPSFMGGLGVPFFLGPIGGGETSPPQLLKSAPWRARLYEFARSVGNRVAALDPFVQIQFHRARLIFCKTRETMEAIPAAMQGKCVCLMEVGTDQSLLAQSPSSGSDSARFLFAGRLLHWKGIHFALRALALVKRDLPDATLTIVGQGRELAWLQTVAQRCGVAESVDWRGWLERSELMGLYGNNTALVFPSLHDSSGNVLLEALSQGLPVICLDLGGPGIILPDDCGFKIPAGDQTEEQVVAALADAMKRIATDQHLRSQFAKNALQAARQQTWQASVARVYELIAEALAAR